MSKKKDATTTAKEKDDLKTAEIAETTEEGTLTPSESTDNIPTTSEEVGNDAPSVLEESTVNHEAPPAPETGADAEPVAEKPEPTVLDTAAPGDASPVPGDERTAPTEDAIEVAPSADGSEGAMLGDGVLTLTDDAAEGTMTDNDPPAADEGEDPKEAAPKPARKTATKKRAAKKRVADEGEEQPEEDTPAPRKLRNDILTIDRDDDVENPDETDDILWHDIQNANRTHRILTGTLGGVERNEAGGTVAIVEYRGLRVAIPAKEMNIKLDADPDGRFGETQTRLNKIINNMLGAEIDFVIKGIDGRTRSVVASRRDAMLRRTKNFYFPTQNNETPLIYPGRLVQARVLAVGEKVIRVDVFGVELTMLARTLSWDWVGDARERYQVGDEPVVKVMSVTGTSPDNLTIEVSARDTTDNTARQALAQCKLQAKYAGTITDIRKGVIYIRLTTGVNAIAHACYDSRRPGRKDDVSFVATEIDTETGVALGIISRIIKRHL